MFLVSKVRTLCVLASKGIFNRDKLSCADVSVSPAIYYLERKKIMPGTLAEYSLLLSFIRYLQYTQVSSRAFNDSILSIHVRSKTRRKIFSMHNTRQRETISALLPYVYFRQQTQFLCTGRYKIFVVHAFRSRMG